MSINLDEYLDLHPTNEQSYRFFMNQHLYEGNGGFVSDGGMSPKNIHVPQGYLKCKNDQREERASFASYKYETLVRENTPHLWNLGIGVDGHIGFNEVGSTRNSITRVVDLDPSTIEANSRLFGGDQSQVPTQAITAGVATIMQAQNILLLANGLSKAEAIKAAIEGIIGPHCPASFLREMKSRVTFMLDKETASLLSA